MAVINQKTYLSCSWGKDVLHRQIAQAHFLPTHWGSTLKGKNFLLKGKLFPFWGTPYFQVIQLALLKKSTIRIWKKWYGKSQTVRVKSAKSQGIWKWRIRGNPTYYYDKQEIASSFRGHIKSNFVLCCWFNEATIPRYLLFWLFQI